MQGHSFGARRGPATVVAGTLLLMTACASPAATRDGTIAPTPTPWTTIRCPSCELANIAVDVRRSVDQQGRPGRYTYARVRNLNDHDIALAADFVLAERSYPDQEIVVERQRLTLAAAGMPAATATVLLEGQGGIAEVSVRGVERF